MIAALVIPPYEDFYHTPHRNVPLGIQVVRHICEAAGYRTVMFNFPAAAGKGRVVRMPKHLDYLKEVMVKGEFGPASFFTRYRRWGEEPHTCARTILASHPDIIMLSCFAYAYSDYAVELIHALRDLDSTIPIIAGGAGVSALPDRFRSADGALTGEAESVLPFLLDSWSPGPPAREEVQERISGISRRHAQPEEIMPVCMYARKGKNSSLFSASITRGCPMNCSFCSASVCHGTEFRAPPLSFAVEACSSVLAQAETPGSIGLNIEDDNILAEPGYLEALARELRKRHPGMTFTAENGIDYRFLDISVLEILISLGFRQFNFSAGTISPGDERNQRGTHLTALVRRCAELAIPSVTYAIVGYPGDTRGQAVQALAFLGSLYSLCGVSPYYAVPGTAGFAEPGKLSSLPSYLCAGSSLYEWGGSLSTRELATLFRLSRVINMKKHPAPSAESRELLHRITQRRMLCTLKLPERRIIELDEPVIDRELSEEFFDITGNLETCRVPGSVK